ncbi:hypothetical protein C7S18_12460 [Ahniella affigens]|uniref:Protein kinase domain-containing protein n=1 Tax=Ahniella affigens TaxID=2021234 RepID=A0A2P1PT12_9GAMM|nr:serine/threonine-protein kinase [Ahniella affigens]AVP97962.1 hypothetical protein C7S18_12460 [Ahniella affigens]
MTTPTTDTDRLVRALQLLGECLELPAAERDAWLTGQCGEDVALKAEVTRLLMADAALDGPLDRPLLEQVQTTSITPDPRIGVQVGPFVLCAMLGRGGMGAVYRAERNDGAFDQVVALKLLGSSFGDDPLAMRRFAQERKFLVRLQHPNIARFLDGGVFGEAQPWYAMELVDGESLTHHVTRLNLPLRARLMLFMQVCDAVQYAHQNLVLHRDLKPANILVDKTGQVKLLDFGIAKHLGDFADAPSTATHAGQRAYTPDYAAPEQIAGGSVSTATDLYALGVIAFELMTGKRPFARDELLRASALGEASLAELPSKRLTRDGADSRTVAGVRGDLDTIVLACLQPNPARRYASASALKRDIERHLAGLPIEARPDSFAYRSSKFVQRHRFAVTAGVLFALALITATTFSWIQAQRAEQASARAAASALTAQRERDAALVEMRLQEVLREHFVAVLNRATEPGTPIDPESLMNLAADPGLLGSFGDPNMQAALRLSLIDLLVHRAEFPKALEMLDRLEPTLPEGPGRIKALAAVNRAFSAIRVGELDVAEASLARAEQNMTVEQRAGGMLVARISMMRGMLLRAKGDAASASIASREAAAQAMTATDTTALERGSVLGAVATAMLLDGNLDAAIDFAGQAEAIWSESNVSKNFAMRTVATQKANALFIRGDLLAAKAALDAINADQTIPESVPARAARDLTEAKVLALLARPGEAEAMVDSAVARMCNSVGETSPDCLRMTLGGIDTLRLSGKTTEAKSRLDRIRPALATQPALMTSANGFASFIALREAPTEANLKTVLDTLPAIASAGSLPRRNVVRALLMLAESMQTAGQQDAANRLAASAITTAGDAIDGNAMDESLLELWQARLQQQPPPPQALAALAKAIGPEHPLVLAHRG